MFSGLERQQAAASRRRSVAWAWVKARSTDHGRTPQRASSSLTQTILSSSTGCDRGQVENWRDRLAEIACQKLARKLCEQFYNFSIFESWRSRPAEAVAASRMLSPALPAYCCEGSQAKADSPGAERDERARILTAVLPPQSGQRGAVLISLRPKAA